MMHAVFSVCVHSVCVIRVCVCYNMYVYDVCVFVCVLYMYACDVCVCDWLTSFSDDGGHLPIGRCGLKALCASGHLSFARDRLEVGPTGSGWVGSLMGQGPPTHGCRERE